MASISLKLMQSGALIGYGQRVKAAFRYLCGKGRSYCIMQDLYEKGKILFPYLCMDIDTDKLLEVIDVFRKSDLHGHGKISLMGFATVIIEQLREKLSDDSLLESLAIDLLYSSNKNAKEILLTISGDETSLPDSYRKHLCAFGYLLEKKIRDFIEDHSRNGINRGSDSFPGSLLMAGESSKSDVPFSPSFLGRQSNPSDTVSPETSVDKYLGTVHGGSTKRRGTLEFRTSSFLLDELPSKMLPVSSSSAAATTSQLINSSIEKPLLGLPASPTSSYKLNQVKDSRDKSDCPLSHKALATILESVFQQAIVELVLHFHISNLQCRELFLFPKQTGIVGPGPSSLLSDLTSFQQRYNPENEKLKDFYDLPYMLNKFNITPPLTCGCGSNLKLCSKEKKLCSNGVVSRALPFRPIISVHRSHEDSDRSAIFLGGLSVQGQIIDSVQANMRPRIRSSNRSEMTHLLHPHQRTQYNVGDARSGTSNSKDDDVNAVLDIGQLMLVQDMSESITELLTMLTEPEQRAVGGLFAGAKDMKSVLKTNTNNSSASRNLEHVDTIGIKNIESRTAHIESRPAHVLLELMSAQQKLCRAEMRIEVLQTMHTRVCDLDTSSRVKDVSNSLSLTSGLPNSKSSKKSEGLNESANDSANEDVEFVDILKELVHLKATAAFRGTDKSLLGRLTAVPSALIPLKSLVEVEGFEDGINPLRSTVSVGNAPSANSVTISSESDIFGLLQEIQEQAMQTFTLNQFKIDAGGAVEPVDNELHIGFSVDSCEAACLSGSGGATDVDFDSSGIDDEFLTADNKDSLDKDSSATTAAAANGLSTSKGAPREVRLTMALSKYRLECRRLRAELTEKDARLSEMVTSWESANKDNTNAIHLSVELQFAREKVLKLEEERREILEREKSRNDVLARNLELERQLHELTSDVLLKSVGGQSSGQSSLPRGAAASAAATAATAAAITTTAAGTAALTGDAEEQLKALKKQLKQLTDAKAKIERENNRVLSSVKDSEQRITQALHENLTLRQHLVQAEDQLAGLKNFVTSMQLDLKQERVLRNDREALFEKCKDLQARLAQKEIDLEKEKEDSALVTKLQEQLEHSEDEIHRLHEESTRLLTQQERMTLAIEQMESYRQQLREQTKQAHEKDLEINKLQSKLDDVKYYQTRHDDIVEQLDKYSKQVQLIPSLLAEVTRLRAVSRAAVKALGDEDKSAKEKIDDNRQLQNEVIRLRRDNGMYVDNERKLRDANEEISKLKKQIGELSARKDGISKSTEEIKSAENTKKVRQRMRASVMMIGAAADLSGIGAAAAAAAATVGSKQNDAED